MKEKEIILIIGVVMCNLFLWPLLADAKLVTIEIEAVVDSVDDENGVLEGKINVGDIITGWYTYDSSATDTSPSSEFGTYVFDSPYGISISLGGIEFKTSPSHKGQFEIKISDNGPNLDYYIVRSSQNTPLSNGATIGWINLGVYGPNEMISSTDLPTTAPVIGQWDTNLFIHGTDVYGIAYNIYGAVTQAELVPEPLTGILVAMGMFFLRHRR